jgi:hypothetical protein
MKKSIMGALSANGLFYQIKMKPKTTKNRRPSMLWRIKENEANEYISLEIQKFVSHFIGLNNASFRET